MAKKSMINREVKRAKLAKKYAARRDELKAIIKDEERSYDDREQARAPAETAARFQRYPHAQSCRLTGRPRLLPQVRPRP